MNRQNLLTIATVTVLAALIGASVGGCPPTDDPNSDVLVDPNSSGDGDNNPADEPNEPADNTPDQQPGTNDEPNVIIFEPNEPVEDPNDDVEQPGDFVAAEIIHRGSEQVIAGPSVDANYSTVYSAGYAPTGGKSVAISGDGTKVWFRLYDEFPNVPGDPQTQLWSVNIDGSNGQRSTLPDTDLRYGLPVETNIDGSVCFGDNGAAKKMYRATPGQPATVVFTYWTQTNGWIYGDIRGEFKITDDASKMVYRSYVDTKIYGVDLVNAPGAPVVIATGATLNYQGTNSRALHSNIDLAGDGSAWILAGDYWNSGWDTPHQQVTWVGNGFGPGATLTAKAVPTPDGDDPGSFNITDDGETVAYTVAAEFLNAPTPIMIQPTTGTSRDEVGDGRTSVGAPVLSDDGTRLYYRTDRAFGNGNSVLVDLATDRRMPVGTGLMDDNPGVDSGNVVMSDDGQIIAAGSTRGVWVLRDGVDGLPGFPSIDGISYRFNDDCSLTIRVAATTPRGVNRIYVTPFVEGEPPTTVLPAEENPTYSFRWGSFNFVEVDGEPGVWEQTVRLTNGTDSSCVEDLLTEDIVLRVVLFDANETFAVFQDFAPGD